MIDALEGYKGRQPQMIVRCVLLLDQQKMRTFFVSICSLFFLNLIVVQCELFTSTTHLTHLLNTEIELSKQLEKYLTEEYQRLERVEK